MTLYMDQSHDLKTVDVQGLSINLIYELRYASTYKETDITLTTKVVLLFLSPFYSSTSTYIFISDMFDL